MVSPQDINGWVAENLPGATVEITGDGHHFEAEIACNDFAVKSGLHLLQMVHGALCARRKAEFHPLYMPILQPEEKISLYTPAPANWPDSLF